MPAVVSPFFLQSLNKYDLMCFLFIIHSADVTQYTHMECAPSEPLQTEPARLRLKRKFDLNTQQEQERYKSNDELELWLHSTGILHSGRVEMLKNFQLDAKNAATDKQREAFDTVTNQLMLNPSCALNHICKVSACVIRKLQETNQLGMIPGIPTSNGKNAKVPKKASVTNK